MGLSAEDWQRCREFCGRNLREAFVEWVKNKPNCKPEWLLTWDDPSFPDAEKGSDMDLWQREMSMYLIPRLDEDNLQNGARVAFTDILTRLLLTHEISSLPSEPCKTWADLEAFLEKCEEELQALSLDPRYVHRGEDIQEALSVIIARREEVHILASIDRSEICEEIEYIEQQSRMRMRMLTGKDVQV